jgi:diguanylate cyclase (GGDEF)-like protein
MKILLVDDTLTERMIITSYLKRMGHEVITGENGEEAVSLFKSTKPDLVLLDVIMPVMDGYQAARQIREATDEWIPIIFLSAKTDPEDIAAGIEAGGDDYLTKPADKIVVGAKMGAMQRIAAMRKRLLSVSQELEDANRELQRLVCIDGLTGLTNRRQLDTLLVEATRRCARGRYPVSVIMADIDHFKSYNDHYGHLEGDDCLKAVAEAIQGQLKRPADTAVRYGGEEFCILLPETPEAGAQHVAESIRRAVESLAISQVPGMEPDRVTLSQGFASCIPEPGFDAAQLIQRADRALYQAKNEGRNRVRPVLKEGAGRARLPLFSSHALG